MRRFIGLGSSAWTLLVTWTLLVAACSLSHPGGAPSPDERVAAWLDACSEVGRRYPPHEVAQGRAELWGDFAGEPFLRPTVIECLEAANDCDAVTACTGSTDTPVSSCEAPRCEGDVAVVCHDEPGRPAHEVRVDCAHLGRSCLIAETGIPVCGWSACGEDGASRCNGSFQAEACVLGVTLRAPCTLGMTCDEDVAMCLGPPCTESRCEGTVLHACEPTTSRAHSIDCAADGLLCLDGGCGTPFDDCNAIDEPPRCDGDELVYCTPSNRIEQFDCRAAGLDGCVAGRCVVAGD